ncbi:MAG: patatin-like phospholipase family protein [Maricaulaceae bacterium]|jgi:NTE family protein
MFSPRRRPVALALQGGGALGAFTWGVLDTLLADDRLDVRAFTGASAGAMNAAVAADGLLEGGPERAREKLAAFWREVAEAGAIFNAAPSAWEAFWRKISPASGSSYAAFETLLKATSPYEINPFNINPLRSILEQTIDFDRLRAAERIKVHVSATNVRTGRARIFTTDELSVEVLLASACLPAIYQAVEIDGEAYWDGGYASNPPLSCLLGPDMPCDAILVPLNPQKIERTPRSADEIADRANELTFNAPYLAELKMLALAKRLVRRPFRTGASARAKALRLHEIASDGELADMMHFDKLKADLAFFEELAARGRTVAANWLAGARKNIGKRSSIDLERDFLDDMW